MEKKEDNTIFLGDKKYGIYVYAIMNTLEKDKKAVIKTRGKHIPKAINIADYLKREKEVKLKEVLIYTNVFKDKEGKDRRVPEIEIKLEK